jgi:hypothetical protein
MLQHSHDPIRPECKLLRLLTALPTCLPHHHSSGGLAQKLKAAITAAGATMTSAALGGVLSSCGFKFTSHQLVAISRRLDKERSGAIKAEELAAVLGV